MWLYWRRWTITRVIYRAFALLILLPSLALAAAVPFEDVDCDGIFTPGLDVDLSSEIGLPGYPPRNLALFVEGCLVLPYGSISPKPWASIFIYARHVTLATPLTATMGDPFSYAFIKGEQGLVATAGVSVGGDMYIGAESEDMYIGNGTRWTSKSSYIDFISNGNLFVGRNVVVRALSYARFIAEGDPMGIVTTEPGLNVLVSDAIGLIEFSAPFGIDIEGATLKANALEVRTPAQPIAFVNSRMRTVGTVGYTLVSSSTAVDMGLVNVSGTLFLDITPTIIGDPIIGH